MFWFFLVSYAQLIGFSSVDHDALRDHFIQFGNLASASKAQRYIMHLIWFSC